MSCGQAALVILEYIGRRNERVGTIEITTALAAKDQSLDSGRRLMSGLNSHSLSWSCSIKVDAGRTSNSIVEDFWL